MAYINGREVLFSANVNVKTIKATLYPPNITITNKYINLNNASNGKHGSRYTWRYKEAGGVWKNTDAKITTSGISYAREGCVYLENLSVEGENFNSGVFPEGLYFDDNGTTISENQYKGNALESYDIASNIESIGARAFQSCRQLKNIKIWYGCKIIREYAFDWCTQIAEITIPSSVTSIGIGAFQYTKIAEITIPSSVTSLGHSAFKYCKSLISARIESAAKIDWQTFRDCTALESVEFAQKVAEIHSSAFQGCTSLKEIFVPWSEGEVANAPWGASPDVTIFYNCEVQLCK